MTLKVRVYTSLMDDVPISSSVSLLELASKILGVDVFVLETGWAYRKILASVWVNPAYDDVLRIFFLRQHLTM